MSLGADDVPTLRLVTLRRLVRASAPLLIFAPSARAGAIADALRDSPRSVAAVVGADGVLCGTLRADDLAGANPRCRARSLLAAPAPVLAPEHDVEAARLVMAIYASDRVAVVDAAGTLLGVLTDLDLAEVRTR